MMYQAIILTNATNIILGFVLRQVFDIVSFIISKTNDITL